MPEQDRIRAMHTTRLGRSGLEVTRLCLGGNVFGWTCDETTSQQVLDAYVDAGGNFIDTADVYSRWATGHTGGESEATLGRWMQARGNRSRLIIATKVGSAMGAGPNMGGLSRQHMLRAVDESLRRLRTDYIDLYQAHFDDERVPLEETLRTFDDLVRQGKVRYIGASNYHAWRLVQALWVSDRHGYAAYVSLQPKYNLVDRDEFEGDLEAACRAFGLGVIPYAPLGGGFLTGKYRREGPCRPPSAPRRCNSGTCTPVAGPCWRRCRRWLRRGGHPGAGGPGLASGPPEHHGADCERHQCRATHRTARGAGTAAERGGTGASQRSVAG